MATLILLFSAAALLQFFISYCRSLIAASIKQPLSAEVRDVTGISSAASGEDFGRVIQLLQLCPERPQDRGPIRAINAYFELLSMARSAFSRVIPALAAWTDVERGQCAYYAAVALDRRIAFSRDMLAQQMDA
jgi:ABC-type multidrug transport system fused ATPase/permease subunit